MHSDLMAVAFLDFLDHLGVQNGAAPGDITRRQESAAGPAYTKLVSDGSVAPYSPADIGTGSGGASVKYRYLRQTICRPPLVLRLANPWVSAFCRPALPLLPVAPALP